MPIFRIFKFVRIVKLLRVFFFISKKNKQIINLKIFNSKLFTGVLKFFLVNSVFIIIFIKQVETNVIKNLFDAFWWFIITITTVGYGDLIAQTIIGKIITTYTIFLGIGTLAGIVSSVTDYISSSKYNKEITKLQKNELELVNKIDLITKQNQEILLILKNPKKT